MKVESVGLNLFKTPTPLNSGIYFSIGSSRPIRRKQLFSEYEGVKEQLTFNRKVLWWNGDKNYDQRNDPKYRSLLTVLNNGT